MSNQDIEGNGPHDSTVPSAPAGTPETVEQQLAKERDARALIRDRLRHTEALAAESHALRARMAQELERVTAERDRLRNAAAAASAAAGSTGFAKAASAAAPRTAPAEPPLMTPRASEWPLKPPLPPTPPPMPSSRKAPWLALAMLGGLAVGVAALAWITGALPGESHVAATSTSAAAPVGAAPEVASAPAVSAAVSASSTLAAATPAPLPSTASSLPEGAVALPPLTPEAMLATAPTAAGNGSGATSAAMASRLRAALDAEGIVAPVDFDAATGHVAISDPAADNALRDRTDMIIRAVYAGASLPEPSIEHRWVSPPRAGRVTTPAALSAAAPAPATVLAPSPALSLAAEPAAPGTVARTPSHATSVQPVDHPRRADGVAEAPDAHPILPAGRVTASCKESVSSRSTVHRAAEISACMKHSCCSSANRQTEECRAYDKAYPFSCSAG